MTYALDTSIVLDILSCNETVNKCRNSAVAAGALLVIPPIVHYETLRGFRYRSATAKELRYRFLTAMFRVGLLTPAMWEIAADIYAQNKRKGYANHDADVLIAAFCLENGYTLVTHNVRHFRYIEGLGVEDWAESEGLEK